MIIDSKYGSVYIIRVATSSLMVRYKVVNGGIIVSVNLSIVE